MAQTPNIHDLVDMPPLPPRQEEGLLWFVFQADAWDSDIGVAPNTDTGIALVFKGSSLDTATRAAGIDSYGNFLDLNHPDPPTAPVVLRYKDYADELAAALDQRNRRN